ncbi:hypothetical protein [Wolbachia endosymbiont of Drosophila incompta]|uniref:hypothetical protein n=1 Tax=Wolbachia endosymbiont of Drosophila incompta TaxID=1633785 RepID=UPI001FDFE91E|nr:hypothetical protein [Wolbachia endosymbiont of Drosophila incompta]
MAILNITKGKNKVIVSGLAGALSALIFLTAIHIAAKIAIIVSAAAVTYLLLSLIHKIRTKKNSLLKLLVFQEMKVKKKVP